MDEAKIRRTLQELGVPNHVKGYKLLIEAIKLAMGNHETYMCNEIITKVSVKFNDTYPRTERSMRHGVTLADEGNSNLYRVLFQKHDGKPPLLNFIATVAEYIEFPSVYDGWE